MPRCRCRCRNCRSNHQESNTDSGLSDTEVCCQTRTAEEDSLRQCNELCRSQQRVEGTTEGVRGSTRGPGDIRGISRNRVQLHSTSSTSLRRSVGSCCQASQTPASASSRQRVSQRRRNGNHACRSGGGAEQPTHSTAVTRSQRRGSTNASTSVNRRGSAFAAARIRRRRERQRAEVLEAMATTLRTQGDVLASLVQRIYTGSTAQGQMAAASSQSAGGRVSDNSRRQPATPGVVDRTHRSRNRRQGRQGQGGRDTHKKRRI
ncbi:uncharacterized protein LOC119616464 isoform X1 [Lucilia sericata]|uniref:uncharacterized protein LOC119610658 isoform X1 n=1 Tax=Lucilia sericata TaxID=13632 RepID=UPI0018A802FC|nr:uncharacterized protein LOC119610658 isoform X1 [Lucilia sericata]XP_037828752.1 uncharacterized protein LOC119616464 isoform X1 [Lucilia sericata]